MLDDGGTSQCCMIANAKLNLILGRRRLGLREENILLMQRTVNFRPFSFSKKALKTFSHRLFISLRFAEHVAETGTRRCAYLDSLVQFFESHTFQLTWISRRPF